MNAQTQQIVSSYEDAGLSPEEIAKIEELDLNAVKATLFSHSGAYRKSVAGDKETVTATGEVKDFENDDNDLALRVIKEIAQMSDDDNIRLKAAMFIRNDKKKRLDPEKGIKSLSLNVNVLNEHFAKVAANIAQKVLPTETTKPVTDI